VAMYLREVCLEHAMSTLPAAKLECDKPTLLPVGRDYLRKKMRERDTTVTALAEELGISRRHLSNVLNGHAPLIDPILHRLCRALLVSPAFLICFLDDGVRPELGRSWYGCMKGSVLWHGDLTEPMEDWEMLED
jgi:DNA-binding Xre family transcriptional regulator